MKLFTFLCFILLFFVTANPVFAQANTQVADFTRQTLSTLIIFATLGAVLFLIKAGYQYITSTGKPDALEQAKKTIRNALIGLVLVLSAGAISQVLTSAFTTPAVPTQAESLQLTPITPVEPQGGLVQVIIDATIGFLQTIIQSATKPLFDGMIGFLTTTPPVSSNSVIFNFWLTMVGIVDALFVLLIAALGFQLMSGASFGYEELELKHILPKIGLAFIGANSSIFLIDWIIMFNNTLVQTLLSMTGGLTNAWVINSINITNTPDEIELITYIFMLLFVLLSALLLLFYIMRLITIALGAVLSPFIFLLWAVPKSSDFAEISAKTYIMTIFTVFVQVVMIQLASAFLTLPQQIGTNSLMSVLVGIGLLFTLLKTPSVMVQLLFYNSGRGMMRKMGGQIMNVITSNKETSITQPITSRVAAKTGKVLAA